MGKRQRQEEEAAATAAAAAAAQNKSKKHKQPPSPSSPTSSSTSGSDSESGRSTDDRGTPAAAAHSGRTVSVPVSVVRESSSRDASAPYVAYFANGAVPAYANEPSTSGAEQWRFRVYEPPSGAPPQQLLVSEQRVATLIGRAADPQLSDAGCQYVLGVYDKEQGTLKVGVRGGLRLLL